MRLIDTVARVALFLAIASDTSGAAASAFDITDLLPKKETSETDTGKGKGKDKSSVVGQLGSFLGNVLGKSEAGIAELTGVWKATGPAVALKSDNLLAKVGGAAGAVAMENKLLPYYNKLGLGEAVITIYPDSSFSIQNRKLNLKGRISGPEDGKYVLKFSAAGLFNFGSAETSLQKSGKTLKMLFDTTTLKNIATGVAKMSGVGIAKTAASLLDNYNGMFVGLSLTRTGDVGKCSSAFATGKDDTTDDTGAEKKKFSLQNLRKK